MTFEAALRSRREELSTVVRGKDAVAITKAAADAQTILTEELAKLQGRQQTLRDAVNRWLRAVGPKRELPDALQKCADTASTALREAAITLNSDCTSAEKKVEDVTQGLLHELRRESARWKEGIKAGLGALTDAAHLILPSPVAGRLAAAADETAKTLSSLVDTEPADAPATGALLETVDRVRRQVLISVIEPIDGALSLVANRVRLALEGAGAVPAALRDEMRAAVSAVGNLLSQGSVEERLNALAPGATQEFDDLDARFGKLIASVEFKDTEAQQEIDTLVRARDYEGAARRAVEAKKAARTEEAEDVKLAGRQSRLGARAFAEPESSASVAAGQGLPKAVPGRWVEMVALEPILPAAEVRVTAAQTDRQIRIAQATQSVIAGVLFLVVAHVTYADRYIGTFPELAGIFFWAFGLDLTIAKLFEAAKGLGTAASTR